MCVSAHMNMCVHCVSVCTCACVCRAVHSAERRLSPDLLWTRRSVSSSTSSSAPDPPPTPNLSRAGDGLATGTWPRPRSPLRRRGPHSCPADHSAPRPRPRTPLSRFHMEDTRAPWGHGSCSGSPAPGGLPGGGERGVINDATQLFSLGKLPQVS